MPQTQIMRDYSTINRSFTKRNSRLTSLETNDENAINGPTKVEKVKLIKEILITKTRTRRSLNIKSKSTKKSSNTIVIKRSPKRKALGDINDGPPMRKSLLLNGCDKAGGVDVDKNETSIQSILDEDEKETKNINVVNTPANKKLKQEDSDVEATDEGYASVSKLAGWLAERPWESSKKPIPSSCP